MTTIVPVIAGWLELGPPPTLIGSRCQECGTVAFPPSPGPCPNPHCAAEALERHALARRGRIWSYTDAKYQPPPPYVPTTDPYVPFAIAAVELDADGIVVLGQLATGIGVDDVHVGDEVELVVERHGDRDGDEVVVWKWRPTSSEGADDDEGADDE